MTKLSVLNKEAKTLARDYRKSGNKVLSAMRVRLKHAEECGDIRAALYMLDQFVGGDRKRLAALVRWYFGKSLKAQKDGSAVTYKFAAGVDAENRAERLKSLAVLCSAGRSFQSDQVAALWEKPSEKKEFDVDAYVVTVLKRLNDNDVNPHWFINALRDLDMKAAA